tara:strand:+ start:493 stop:768 length:276 start_codon:yes stop_codon:yes gene_type:complete
MDSSINYPYGIPFFSDQKFITVYFQNNDKYLYTIYFVKNKKVENLAGILFAGENKKYNFPENSIVAIILENKPKEVQTYIKLKDGWTYTYP